MKLECGSQRTEKVLFLTTNITWLPWRHEQTSNWGSKNDTKLSSEIQVIVGRFVNSAFPNKKNLAFMYLRLKFIYDKPKVKQLFVEILHFK